MIFGIGVDAVAIVRMQNNIKRYGQRFAGRILSQQELKEYSASHMPANYLAKHFAAKEAISKALGTGIRKGVSFRNISIKHDELGKPELIYNGSVKDFIESRKIVNTHLSITDEKDYAFACVVLEINQD